jgi:hypothetical protein
LRAAVQIGSSGWLACWQRSVVMALAPASVLAQAVRRPDRQVRLARLIRQAATDVIDLGRVDAAGVGRLPTSYAT